MNAVSAQLAFSTAFERLVQRFPKIALLGDSGVGKTGLGWRLANGSFAEQSSTHGQQFWILYTLAESQAYGRDCDVILWDLAGQPDYRLVHSLFIDDIDLGLLLFDPTEREHPFGGVEYWMGQITSTLGQPVPTILVGGRIDRGVPTLTTDDLTKYCKERNISGGYVGTSAKDGTGIEELVARIKGQLDWDKIPATITTATFRTLKGFVLSLKGRGGRTGVLIDAEALLERLRALEPEWEGGLPELMGAVKYLQNHGYVRLLKRPSGGAAILLVPDIIANVASSIVLSARRDAEGLGSLDEDVLLNGQVALPELEPLSKTEKETLINSIVRLFLEKNICFRETVGRKTYLVFPSLINERPPLSVGNVVEDMFYHVSGSVANLYASLVVLLGYTNTFTRTHHWKDQAQYELGPGQICGFRQVAGRDSEVELTLYYGDATPDYVRLLFRGLFEKFLSECDVVVERFHAIFCPECSERQERAVVLKQVQRKLSSVYCSYCGVRIQILDPSALPRLSPAEERTLSAEEAVASRRTAFESAIVWLKSTVRGQDAEGPLPVCFISYSWGVPEDVKWVHTLAVDLRNAAVRVVIDRWHNTPGTSISKFIERISSADCVLAVGTPELRRKYDTEAGDPVVDAELRLIGTRLRKRSEERERVIPILLSGEPTTSFPPQFEDSVFLDFRLWTQYFAKLFDLILTIHRIPFDRGGVDEMRESLESATR